MLNAYGNMHANYHEISVIRISAALYIIWTGSVLGKVSWLSLPKFAGSVEDARQFLYIQEKKIQDNEGAKKFFYPGY
jgi:hypothetical protein